MVCMLLLRVGREPFVVSRAFDATLEYPGEGPRRQALPPELRPRVDLADGPARTPGVRERRRVCLRDFREWADADVDQAQADLLPVVEAVLLFV